MLKKTPNRLINETSPYLLQHAYNPVDWYPWGKEALEKAKKENKLLLISIGYSACHWCHVMERESFENEEVAHVMNGNFVCIKVDREERPDVDQIYMDAVQLIRGQGGWPLNCFALPDGKPVFGGTYFPKEQWIHTLNTLQSNYLAEPKKFNRYAEDLMNGITRSELISEQSKDNMYEEDDLKLIVKNITKSFDLSHGGFGRAPKFPLPVALNFLMQYGHTYKDDEVLDFIVLSLQKMARGGIYDQIGGGFSRYSVDNYWLVPHFEKMLYDNAQLVSLYSRIYQAMPNEEYLNVIDQSLEFVGQELMSDEDGFYSALDADSEGVEGKYYVWSKSEIERILGHQSEMFCKVYNVTDMGNWEASNILNKKASDQQLSIEFGYAKADLQKELKSASQKLLEYRQKRIRPGLDDKIIVSWNAMMSIGFLDAYAALGKTSYLKTAEKNIGFIWAKMASGDGKLFRTYKKNKARIDAFLDDYAFFMQLLLKAYQFTFNKVYLDRALLCLKYVLKNFSDPKSSMFFYSEADDSLIVRKMEVSDNVIPASNSVMGHLLLDFGILFSKQEWQNRSKNMLLNIQENLKKGQIYYANWDLLLLRHLLPTKEVVIMGENAVDLSRKIQKQINFNILFAGSSEEVYLDSMKNRLVEGKTLIYVCEKNSCKLAVESVEEAMELIKE